MCKVNRITIRIHDDHPSTDLGLTNFTISLQGKPHRPPRNAEDLFSVRGELKSLGFIRVAGPARIRATYRGRPGAWEETWHLATTSQSADSTPMLTRVIYNYSRQQYQITSPTGQVLGEAPSALEAQWHEIRVHDLELHRLAIALYNRYPDLNNRVIRAAQLVARGHVSLDPFHTLPDLVRSQTNPNRAYLVTRPDSGPWTCTIQGTHGEECPDCEFGAPILRAGRGPRCKHMIAAYLHDRLSMQKWAREAEMEPGRLLVATGDRHDDAFLSRKALEAEEAMAQLAELERMQEYR